MIFFHKLFREYRESKCLTLLQIGKKIGVSKQTVQKYEAGKTKPKPETVYKIAEVLGISVVDISDLKPEKDLQKEEIIPTDDFFKIILESWPFLTNKEKLNLASEASHFAEKNRGIPPSSTSSEAEKKRA